MSSENQATHVEDLGMQVIDDHVTLLHCMKMELHINVNVHLHFLVYMFINYY